MSSKSSLESGINHRDDILRCIECREPVRFLKTAYNNRHAYCYNSSCPYVIMPERSLK